MIENVIISVVEILARRIANIFREAKCTVCQYITNDEKQEAKEQEVTRKIRKSEGKNMDAEELVDALKNTQLMMTSNNLVCYCNIFFTRYGR